MTRPRAVPAQRLKRASHCPTRLHLPLGPSRTRVRPRARSPSLRPVSPARVVAGCERSWVQLHIYPLILIVVWVPLTAMWLLDAFWPARRHVILALYYE